jgi:hypothetical protein
MKPIPLHNPKSDRRHKAIMVVLLTLSSFLVTEPKTAIGVAITLATVPFILIGLLNFRWWWHVRFGGSKLLTLVFIAIILCIALSLAYAADLLKPYIGEHFA